MPVKISSNPDTRAITTNEYTVGRANFYEHYYPANGGGALGGQVIPINWTDFSNALSEYTSTFPSVDEELIGIRFVHCYNVMGNTLYLRMEVCELLPTDMTDFARVVRQISSENTMWFEIQENNISQTSNDLLYDSEYMNNILYKSNPTEQVGELIVNGPTKYVRNMTYPWKNEILRMYQDNGSPEDAVLNFASCSYLGNDQGDAAVRYPHGLVLYLSVDGEPLMDNEDYITVFSYKGCDDGTLCPPKCGSYISPNTINTTIPQ